MLNQHKPAETEEAPSQLQVGNQQGVCSAEFGQTRRVGSAQPKSTVQWQIQRSEGSRHVLPPHHAKIEDLLQRGLSGRRLVLGNTKPIPESLHSN